MTTEFIDDHFGLQIATVALLGLAVVPIIVGSFTSLSTMKKPAKRKRRSTSKEYDTYDEREKSQVLTTSHAFCLPLICSSLVYAFYIVLNEIKPTYIHQAIEVVISILSCTVFSNTAVMVIKNQLAEEFHNQFTKYKISFSKSDHQDLFSVKMTVIHVLVLIVSVALAVLYALTQHWMIGNLFAWCLAITAISLVTVDSFATGYLLLVGMLVYDVIWLFGTDIMMHISLALEHAPISVLWPRNINTYVYHKLLISHQYFTMFGLGDIIVPGIFIAYCLRIDKLNANKYSAKRAQESNFPKPYFSWAVFAYIISAGTSIYTVHFTKQPQSALVYIVPSLIMASLLTATARNELGNVLFKVEDILKTVTKIGSVTEEQEDERPDRFHVKIERAGSTSRGRGRGRGRGGSRSVSKSKKRTKQVIEELKEHANEPDILVPKVVLERKKRSSSRVKKQ